MGWLWFTLLAVVGLIIVGIYGARNSSSGYYDHAGRKIPLDDIHFKIMDQDEKVSRLKTQLESERQQSSNLLQRFEELEKRIEVLEKEKKGSS
jgi:hypothetical protein